VEPELALELAAERPPRPGPVAVVGVSLASLAVGTFASVGIGTLAPELQDALGLSRAEIGLLTAFVYVGSALASRPAGKLTDSVGAVRVLVLSLLLAAGALALAALAPFAGVLMVAAFAAGLANGGVNPPTNVVIAGQMTSRLGLFLSIKQTGVPAGGFLAGLVLPPVALALSWRWAFGVLAALALAVAASTWAVRGARVLSGGGSESGPPALGRRERITIAFYGLVMAGTQWSFLTYLVLYLTDGEGFSLREAGLALSLATACSVGGRVVWGWLSDRPGRRVPVLLLASGVAVAMLSLLAAGMPGAALWPIAGATGAALVGWNGVFHALLAERAGPGSLGRASGEVMAFVFSGAVVIPPALGAISEGTSSWTALWALAAGLAALAAIVLRLGLRPA
jgi:MFS family permease